MTSWRKTHGNNAEAEIFNTKSIAEISSKDIIKEAFPNGKPDHFGVIGGPPCQDFSMNGSRKGFEGERGKLTTIFLNKIAELKPTFFVMENVPGLLRVNSSRVFLENLLSSRLKEEYKIDYKKLNALDFGVPQSRERLFFIGIKRDALNLDAIKLPPNNWFPLNAYSL